jgi:hypothetical protein
MSLLLNSSLPGRNLLSKDLSDFDLQISMYGGLSPLIYQRHTFVICFLCMTILNIILHTSNIHIVFAQHTLTIMYCIFYTNVIHSSTHLLSVSSTLRLDQSRWKSRSHRLGRVQWTCTKNDQCTIYRYQNYICIKYAIHYC